MPGTTIELSQQESDQLILSTKRVIIVANTNVFKTTITIITKQQQKSRVWLDWKNNNFARALGFFVNFSAINVALQFFWNIVLTVHLP